MAQIDENTFWLKVVGIVLTMLGLQWGNHRYTNTRIDKLNTAVGDDVAKVKEEVNECEKTTLSANGKIDNLSVIICRIEETVKSGQEAIFEELKHLRRKGGE
jgi:hypothetical protein